MSTILPPGAQAPPPQPAPTAQAAPTAVVREPTVELLRVATGTRIEGTVVPQTPTPQPNPPPQQADAARLEAARTAVQTLQSATDTARAETARSDTARADLARTEARSAPPPQTSPQTPSTQASSQSPPPAPPQVTVRTPVGDVTLRTPLPIPDGARVAFDIASTNANQVTVRLSSLNGQPIQQALVQLAADRAAPPPPGTPPPAPTGPLSQTGPAPLGLSQVWTPGGPIALTQAGPLNAYVIAGTSPAPIAGQPIPPQTTGPQAAQGTGTQIQTTAGPQPLFTGSDITIRITAVGTGQPGTTPAGQTAPTASPNLASQATSGGQANAAPQTTQASGTPVQGTLPQGASQTTPQPPQGPGSLLPASGNTQSGLRLVGAQGWPQPPLATPGNVQSTPIRLALTGMVTAQSTAGQTLIQTDAGTVQLASRVNLPPGTTVTLDVLAQAAPRPDASGAPLVATAPPTATPALPFTTGATPWPALTEALQVLQRSDPQAAQLLSNALPDGGPRTVVAALSFIQAMRNGDPRQWPGDNNLRALERAGPRGAHLARTVSGEVAQLSAQSREATGEWRSTPIPWNTEGQIEKINLITRREDPPDDDEEKEPSNKKAGLRFLLDLELTNLGEVQLDGMVKEDTKGFDLMIRSHASLNDTIRRDLTGLFIATNLAVGLKGQLTFQVTQKFADPIGSSAPLKQERDGVWA